MKILNLHGGGHSGATLPLKEYFGEMLPYFEKNTNVRNTTADRAEKHH